MSFLEEMAGSPANAGIPAPGILPPSPEEVGDEHSVQVRLARHFHPDYLSRFLVAFWDARRVELLAPPLEAPAAAELDLELALIGEDVPVTEQERERYGEEVAERMRQEMAESRIRGRVQVANGWPTRLLFTAAFPTAMFDPRLGREEARLRVDLRWSDYMLRPPDMKVDLALEPAEDVLDLTPMLKAVATQMRQQLQAAEAASDEDL